MIVDTWEEIIFGRGTNVFHWVAFVIMRKVWTMAHLYPFLVFSI